MIAIKRKYAATRQVPHPYLCLNSGRPCTLVASYHKPLSRLLPLLIFSIVTGNGESTTGAGKILVALNVQSREFPLQTTFDRPYYQFLFS
jgi:hypothetical protein